MATVTVYATGDQIATYQTLTTQGNSNGIQVRIGGAQTLGSSTDVFRIVITQVNTGELEFTNGQFVSIYAYPDTSTPPVPLYSNLNPQHDQFQGRASSEAHQIFTQPAKIIFDINGFPTLPNFRYGPGLNPPRADKMNFDAFPSTPPSVPCFVQGTLIDTVTGRRPIETLCTGDLIRTHDSNLQPIRWIASRSVPGTDAFAPVCIAAGALDNQRDLWVSPQHRMLITDWRAEMYFGAPQVLVAAKHLINDLTIRQIARPAVNYWHMVFDAHEIVLAEGIPSESLHLGQTALSSLDRAARSEVLALFPQLRDRGGTMPTARTCLRAWEGRLIA